MGPASLALAALVAMGGCGLRSAADELQAGRTELASGTIATAKVHLKSALQSDPDGAEARYLLARALMSEGAYADAVLEFNKARAAGHAPDEVVPQLARAMLLDGAYKRVIEELASVKLGSPAARADLLASVVSAHVMLQDRRKAQELLDAALAAAPDQPALQLVQARLLASGGKAQAAAAIVDRLLSNPQAGVDAWLLAGDLQLYEQRQFERAIAAYRKAVELDRLSLRAHIQLATTLMLAKRNQEALEQIKAVGKVFASHPQVVLLAAQMNAQRGEHQAARELFDSLMRNGQETPMLVGLAGANELALGAIQKAETLLAKALKMDPRQGHIRLMLAQVLLQAGKPGKALEVLQPMLQGQPDSEAFFLAAMASAQAGDRRSSDGWLDRLASLSGKSTAHRTALALRDIERGRVEQGFGTLRELAASDQGFQPDLALIGVQMRRGEWGPALQSVEKLRAKQPKLPLALDIKARILLAQKDAAGARATWNEALALRGDYFPAVQALASLDAAQGKAADAEKRVKAFADSNPSHVEAAMRLASMLGARKAPVDEVVAQFQRARSAAPSDRRPRLAQIDFLLSRKQASQALVSAQEAVAVLPNDPDVLDALGRAQMAAGETQQAISTFNKMAATAADSTKPLARLAVLQAAQGDRRSAEATLQRAFQMPGSIAQQQALIQVALSAGLPDAAVRAARAMQAQPSRAALGFALEGDILRLQKKYAAARGVYEAGMAKVRGSGYLATKVHAAWMAEGKPAEAERFAKDWLRKNPGDVAMPFQLGMQASNQSRFEDAERQFRSVVAIQPGNAEAMNNLAWAAAHNRRPDALAMVDAALKQRPDDPAFLDTKANVLALLGRASEALAVAEQAVAQPGHPFASRVTLARIQAQAGDRAGALRTLDEAQSAAESDGDREQVRRARAAL